MRMTRLRLAAIVAATGFLLYSGDRMASASGGGHGSGGHSSGGHSSGGHASGGGRSAGGHSSGGHASSGRTQSGSHATAAPRGSSVSSSGTTTSTASGAAPSIASGDSSGHRQQNGQPTVGVAVPRLIFSAPAPGFLPSRVFWPYYGPAYGFGAFSSLYASRYPTFGFGYGGYGSGGYDTFGGWPYSGYGATDPLDPPEESGSLRLEVDPKDAEVFVDGYYAGIVDEFDGHFQKLDLIPGPHHVEIRRPGYEPLVFDIVTEAHHKETYRGKLNASDR